MSETSAAAWARCKPFAEAAIRRFGEGSIEEVERELAAGRAWLVSGQRMGAVLQITRDCNVWLAAGDMAELLQTLPRAEQWAAAQGCDRMTLIGRKGWQRVLEPHGYRPIHMLAKDLT